MSEMIQKLKAAVLELLENQPTKEMHLKVLYKAAMEPFKSKFNSKVERKDMFTEFLVNLKDQKLVDVDENQIVHLKVLDNSFSRQHIQDNNDQQVSHASADNFPTDSIGHAAIECLRTQPQNLMNQKLLRKVVMKPYQMEKKSMKLIFQDALNKLQSNSLIEVGNKVVRLVDIPVVIKIETDHQTISKKQKTSHNTQNATQPQLSNLDASDSAHDSLATPVIGMGDVILSIMSKRHNNAWIGKSELRQYTFEQYISTLNKDELKTEFKHTLKTLCLHGHVEKSEDGVRVAIHVDENVHIKLEQFDHIAPKTVWKRGKWNEEEVAQLMELVPLHRQLYYGKDCPDWSLIERILNRSRTDCQKRYYYHSQEKDLTLTTGPFSPEEDEIIRETVDIFNGDTKSPDLWLVLAADLNRDKNYIKERWHVIRSDDGLKHNVYWTTEMDNRLIEAHEVFGGNWKKIAEHLGVGDASRVGDRWREHLCPEQKARNNEPWTESEIVKLHELVPKYTYDRVSRQDVVVNWSELSRELNRKRHSCCDKWKSITQSQMKQGVLSLDECDLIRKRVEEWGSKGKGLWTSLERELGRSAACIQHKWSRELRHLKEADDI